uniref:Uncharacterized protein n=1 Tax=Tetradesmus obliquus TaxID=3088 RepID=A0A383WGM4_TETOB|eukprot:jgi/Sobl393_1/5012/SZX76645.1
MGVLSLAAAQGDVPMCELLLEYGADISQRDTVGATSLIHAAARGATAAVQLLLASKAGANLGRQWLLQQATEGGETAVMAAAKGGHLDTLQALCAAGADPAAASARGVTALLLAAKHNRAAVVQHLATQCGCSCSQADSSGTSPLMAAAAGAAREVVALLLQHSQQWGVQLAAVDAAGDGAVVYAARGGDAEVLQMLAAAGLPLTAQWPCWGAANASKQQNAPTPACQPTAAGLAHAAPAVQPTPLMPGAAQRGCCPAPCGVLAGLCLDGGDALMYVAAAAGSVGVVAWLLQQGIGVKCLAARDKHSAVFAAVRQGQADMVRYLVQQGASLEARDERGRTPLAWVAAAGAGSMVRLLVGLGADLLAADSAGMVPRQLAHATDQRSTAELLTQLARDKLLLHCSDDGSC